MITLIELPKLCNSQVAITAAYRASLPLQERGWIRYPAPSWEKPAIVAMVADGRCVGGLCYSVDEDERTLGVNFAFADADQPSVFTRLLMRLRGKFRNSDCSHITFMCHEGSEQMAKAVRALGLEPVSHSYRMPFERLRGGAR